MALRSVRCAPSQPSAKSQRISFRRGSGKTHFGLDADKEKSRALAIRLWPGCGYFSRVKDHGRSEAALIARYGAETIATNFATPSGKGEGGRLLPPTTHR